MSGVADYSDHGGSGSREGGGDSGIGRRSVVDYRGSGIGRWVEWRNSYTTFTQNRKIFFDPR